MDVKAPDAVRYNGEITEDELAQRIEGKTFNPMDKSKDHFICDFCSKGVNYGSKPRVGMYYCDDVLDEGKPEAVWMHDNRPLIPMASYCEDCSTQMLYFPCEGFGEARVFVTVGEGREMVDVEVTDLSLRDDGIQWDPKELSERVTGVPFQANALMGDELWGPENMVTFFLSLKSGIDIRELIDWKGNIDPKLLGQARKSFEKVMQKMQETGGSRESFKEHVRNGR